MGALRNAIRDLARPPVLWAGSYPNAADHAVPADASRRSPDLEAADVLVAVRDPRQGAELPRFQLGRLHLRPSAGVDRHGPRLAVDAVHDVDHARRATEPAFGHPRGGRCRWRYPIRHLPAANPAPSAPLPGARRV